MNRLSPRLLCQAYALLVLLAGAITSPLPYSPIALALLLVILFTTIRPPAPGTGAAVMVITTFLTPLALEPAIGYLPQLPPLASRIIAAVLALPLFYLLDHYLRQRTRQRRGFATGRAGRQVTRTFISLLAASLTMMLLSPVLDRPVLLITGIALTLYLAGTLIRTLLTIPRLPLDTTTTRKRIIAGNTGSLAVDITSRASASLYTCLSPVEPWVSAGKQDFISNKDTTTLELSLTPPLAGKAKPQLKISATDSRGFVRVNQVLEPLQLNVIPRAKYAGWLARKYLEQTTAAGIVTAVGTPRRQSSMRGTDYRESRTYQPGDQLKDIDWKHTTKLSQFIVKEYTESNEQAAVIAVNLTASDAEEADKLAFNLITTALTLAEEGIPTALAAYNHQRAILSTPTLDPNDILRQTLALVEAITLTTLADRHLESYDITRIRRNITLLKRTESEPARRLLGMLDFEYRAIEEAARKHPATIAISAATGQSPTPAMILLISPLNHDAEAVMVTVEKLSHRMFTTIPVATAT